MTGATINLRRCMAKKYRTIDLFAGVGGIRMGFERTGFQTVFANDFDFKCKETYDLNFSSVPLTIKDIRDIDVDNLPEFDFLLGGFPCQPFSVAGYQQGFNDEQGRGNLFFNIEKIIKKRKPVGFLLENVKNLYTHDNKNTFNTISKILDSLGYDIKAKVLNSMEYGNIPQNRERIYIVGFLKETDYMYNFEFPKKIPLTLTVKDLLDDDVPNKYYYNNKPLFKQLKDYPFEENRVYQWRRKYIRENKKGVCPTLTANMGMGGHNVPIIKDRKGIRKLTPKECSRLQGFPENYKFPNIADSHLYKQLGNSVSVSVIERIAHAMQKTMLNKNLNKKIHQQKFELKLTV